MSSTIKYYVQHGKEVLEMISAASKPDLNKDKHAKKCYQVIVTTEKMQNDRFQIEITHRKCPLGSALFKTQKSSQVTDHRVEGRYDLDLKSMASLWQPSASKEIVA